MKTLTDMRILIVDDFSTMRRIIRGLLKEIGYLNSEEAEDGVQALERIKDAWPIDLAVVDWNMPNMNGLELIREIRRRPEWNDMRIMMATTESEISQMQLALDAGADEYLMKPFEKEALVDKIQMVGLTPPNGGAGA